MRRYGPDEAGFMAFGAMVAGAGVGFPRYAKKWRELARTHAVDLAQQPVDRDDAVSREPRDRRNHQLDVGPLERRQVMRFLIPALTAAG